LKQLYPDRCFLPPFLCPFLLRTTFPLLFLLGIPDRFPSKLLKCFHLPRKLFDALFFFFASSFPGFSPVPTQDFLLGFVKAMTTPTKFESCSDSFRVYLFFFSFPRDSLTPRCLDVSVHTPNICFFCLTLSQYCSPFPRSLQAIFKGCLIFSLHPPFMVIPPSDFFFGKVSINKEVLVFFMISSPPPTQCCSRFAQEAEYIYLCSSSFLNFFIWPVISSSSIPPPHPLR